MKVTRQTIYTTVVCLGLTALLSACKKPAETTAEQSKPALKVTLTHAQRSTINDDISATGSIAARAEVLLGVELSGMRVEQVLVDVGQAVRAGQSLLKLDDRMLRMSLVQVQAQRKQAQASLTVAQADAKRGAQLRARGLTSQRDTDQVTAALLNAQAGLEVSNAAVQAAQLQLSFATLSAPSDGIISARNVQPGSVVTPGADLFRLIKNSALEWRAELGPADFLRVKIGDLVQIDAGGIPVQGKVRAMDAGLDMKTRTGFIYADLPIEISLHAGMFAGGKIQFGSRETLLLSASSIVQRDGYSYVFTEQGGVVTQKQIQVGNAVGQNIEVQSGLSPDTAVIAEGAGFLTDGDRVQVFARAAQTTASPAGASAK